MPTWRYSTIGQVRYTANTNKMLMLYDIPDGTPNQILRPIALDLVAGPPTEIVH